MRHVYVHYPWCLKKCPYCDFLSVATEAPAPIGGAARRDARRSATYADAVIAELSARRRHLDGAPGAAGPVESVFFGGGTPTLWHAEGPGRVLAAIDDAFGLAADCEVTVECNPTSLDRRHGDALAAVGVSRLSVGVQSLDVDRLRFLGRLHDPGDALRAVRDAVASDVPRVSADLIFGVAGQSPESARDEAATLADLGLTHVSAYALTIEPGTRFGAEHRKGRLPLLDEALVAASFEAVEAALTSRGLEHYEVSNHATPGHESRHNLGYWLGHDHLGLGCGAYGTVSLPNGATVRYRTTPSPDRYLASAERWALVDPFAVGELVSEVEPLDGATRLTERLMLGLRIAGGIDLDAVAAELGVDPWTRQRQQAIERLLARGHLERAGTRLAIPRSAWLLADGIIAELI